MNLTTARSGKRAREVGIRKAIGSRKEDLIIQFLGESLFTAFLAFLLSLAIVVLVLPLLKNLDFENVRFNLTNVRVLIFVLGVCIITGLIAGSYPAFYLSSFVPVKVLKGAVTQGKGAVSFPEDPGGITIYYFYHFNSEYGTCFSANRACPISFDRV
jgi:hypothetical protein